MITRRNALLGLFLAAPAIVAAPSLMRVSAQPKKQIIEGTWCDGYGRVLFRTTDIVSVPGFEIDGWLHFEHVPTIGKWAYVSHTESLNSNAVSKG